MTDGAVWYVASRHAAVDANLELLRLRERSQPIERMRAPLGSCSAALGQVVARAERTSQNHSALEYPTRSETGSTDSCDSCSSATLPPRHAFQCGTGATNKPAEATLGASSGCGPRGGPQQRLRCIHSALEESEWSPVGFPQQLARRVWKPFNGFSSAAVLTPFHSAIATAYRQARVLESSATNRSK